MNRAITSNFHKPISASPETAYQVLRQFESRARLEESLAALGVEDRVISSHRIELAPRRASGYSLVWRLADGCRAELTWTALVRPDGDEGSVLSIRLRASADDARSTVLPFLKLTVECGAALLTRPMKIPLGFSRPAASTAMALPYSPADTVHLIL